MVEEAHSIMPFRDSWLQGRKCISLYVVSILDGQQMSAWTAMGDADS